MTRQPAGQPEPVPHFYIALEDLHVHHPESGVMPAVAFRAGDQVPADLVEPNGWGSKVRQPEPPSSAPPPRPAPAAAPATPSKE